MTANSGRKLKLLLSLLLLIGSGLVLVGVAFTYISLQPVVDELGTWIANRDANLQRMGIDPKLSEAKIADALTAKIIDQPDLLDETQSSLDHRSRIYDQTEDRPILAAGCYLLALKSPADTAAVLAESGLFLAFWPAFILVIALAAAAAVMPLWRGRASSDATAAQI